MIFTTFTFAVFFLIVYSLYLGFQSQRWRHLLLLISSSVFYAWWDYRFLALMWSVILIPYFTAILFESKSGHKKTALVCAIVALLGLITAFKYTNFFLQSFVGLASLFGLKANYSPIHILLPVGISFYVFHGISYLVDAYHGVIPVERKLSRVALYISYFPQLVAGPIVRASDFMPQLAKNVAITPSAITTGLKEFAIGLLYKTAFADGLAQFADPIFSELEAYNNVSVVCATVAFYGQIYFDFAGYSLMAIGLARLMGYNFPLNFDHPYGSCSITDFWHRWHISLSTWLRNYLYIPLGGNRHGRLKQYRNLFITMFLGGLWHGASWNFVFWGGLHGAALAFHKFWTTRRGAVSQAISSPYLIPIFWLATQLFVLLCWVPFRLPHFTQTLEVYSAFVGLRPDKGLNHAPVSYWWLFAPLIIDTAFGKFGLGGFQRLGAWVPQAKRGMVLAFTLGILFAVVLTLMNLTTKPFIYFQF